MKNYIKAYGISILASLFTTYCIYEKFILPELQIPSIITIIFICSLYIFYTLHDIISRAELADKIAYITFSLFMVIGDSFKKYDSFFGVFGNPFKDSDITQSLFEDFSGAFSFLNGFAGNFIMILGSVCKGIGYYFIIKGAFEFTKYLFRKFIFQNKKENWFINFLHTFFEVKPFVKVLVFFIAAWLPYLIIKLPASVTSDAMSQINQVLENRITTHHPFFTTLLYGAFAKLGIALGDMRIGLSFLIILQYIFMACSFSYCICSLDKIHKNHFLSFFLVLMFSFSPAFPCYATTLIKDALYSTFFVLFITHFILVVHKIETNSPIIKNIIYLTIFSIFVCLTRNNGVYSVIPTLILLAVYFLIFHKNKFRIRSVVSIILLIPLLFYIGYDCLQFDILKIKKGSLKEVLSIPFQQTARYVKEHPDEVSCEDAQIIDKVLDFNNLPTLYNPILSDPVKATYKENAADLRNYFKVWFKHMKLHPRTYIEATINTCYFAFYPDEPNIRAYAIMDSHSNKKSLKILLLAYSMGLSLIPIISIIINPVFFVWLLIYLLIKTLFNKRCLHFLLLTPLLIQLLTVIAGPAVFNHPRYIYPIYWSISFIASFLLTKENKH